MFFIQDESVLNKINFFYIGRTCNGTNYSWLKNFILFILKSYTISSNSIQFFNK